ncbi:MAG TPA: ribbon-helix-helix protein, CopG family [Thermoanaerobaculia bacterium]|nr:ribbon-helix-helix protein, CopG family [Thermoanaerobaculia bacterium]
MSKSISVRLADDTAKALEELSRASDRPKTYFIEKALDSYLSEAADYQVALDRLRDKDDPVISAAEMRKRIGRKKG